MQCENEGVAAAVVHVWTEDQRDAKNYTTYSLLAIERQICVSA